MPERPAISIEGLGKRYLIGHEARHDTLRDTLAHGARGLWRRLVRGGPRRTREEFWALRDVSFDVAPGEVVGIIGRNGAGKSTLLKILSRITEPTTGRAVIRGRVASLLEVGTGFHPELTGRENIFLNGAILGMARAEIAQKFDEIVAFAEVERFLDTPVKHYSSGMYVRLAFAVAAHLEPEILIVDEVLAVGDMAFQKRCLGRMDQVAHSGRTVLFVSHNLEALVAVCPHGLLLEQGQLVAFGAMSHIADRYRLPQETHCARFEPRLDAPSITRVELDSGQLARGVLRVTVEFSAPSELRPPVAGIVVSGRDGRPLFGTNMRVHPPAAAAPARSGRCVLTVPAMPLLAGVYQISAWLGDEQRDYDRRPDALVFSVNPPVPQPAAALAHTFGPLDLPCRWEILTT